MTTKMAFLLTSELRLGDVVRQTAQRDAPFATCVVTQIADGMVHLFRPYGVTADFSYTGGVIPYVGIEQWQVSIDSPITWDLFERKELK